MNMGVDQDACDTGLVLGLGYSDPSPKLEPVVTNPKPLEPSLTLGLSDDVFRPTMAAKEHGLARQSSSLHSTLSSFSGAYPLMSIKRENDIVMNEEAERALSRASDEDEDGGAKKKLRLTKEQSALLEDKFKEHSTLNPKQKQALARQLNLRPRQVEVWFQNRRARTKLKQTEVDCEVLKRCCETLSDENRRLQKELEELRALKLASPPVYMQFPAGSLTVCPSCERVAGAPNSTKTNPFAVVPKTQFLNPFTRSAAC